jgi:hypothetical protein
MAHDFALAPEVQVSAQKSRDGVYRVSAGGAGKVDVQWGAGAGGGPAWDTNKLDRRSEVLDCHGVKVPQ